MGFDQQRVVRRDSVVIFCDCNSMLKLMATVMLGRLIIATARY